MPLLFSLIVLRQRHLAAILRLLNRQMSVLFFQLENIPQNLIHSKSAMRRLNILLSFSPLEIAISEKQWVCACCTGQDRHQTKIPVRALQIETPEGESDRVSCRLTPNLCAKCNCQRHCCSLMWRANFKLLYKTFQMLVYDFFILFLANGLWKQTVLLKQTATLAQHWALK